jgi:Cof subfamily protein (haloacid dehalogenase superfamily)
VLPRPSPKEPVIEAQVLRAPTLRPRLLACDIDGTILAPEGELRPAVRDALATVADSGVTVVLVTGRSPWSGVAELAAQLGLPGAQMTMQGALYSVPATGEVYRLCALSPQIYRDVLVFADWLGIDPIVALVDGHRAERLTAGQPFAGHLAGEADRIRYVPDLGVLMGDLPLRVYLPTGPDRHFAVRREARERFAGRASVVWSDLEGVEILAPGVNKGGAIRWLADGAGFGIDEVAAVGDGWNDVEMLAGAGWSAVMASAPPEIRSIVDIVVPPSAHDGVIAALAWFFPDLAARLPEPFTAPRRALVGG